MDKDPCLTLKYTLKAPESRIIYDIRIIIEMETIVYRVVIDKYRPDSYKDDMSKLSTQNYLWALAFCTNSASFCRASRGVSASGLILLNSRVNSSEGTAGAGTNRGS